MFHTDFDASAQPGDEAPLVLFVGLSETCRVGVMTGNEMRNHCSTYTYGHGDVVLMHGFAVHRGCSYQEENFRLYFIGLHPDVLEKQPNIGTEETFEDPEWQIKRLRKKMDKKKKVAINSDGY